ncbi:unnamed protein product [Linum tenue]|uniref:Uncharacterized protein n=1 Tax=Linum tenue TaxID=586396 RepID=A0AAV0N2S4_9ROSI|nr:unnamed protein product [Linum tenue]
MENNATNMLRKRPGASRCMVNVIPTRLKTAPNSPETRDEDRASLPISELVSLSSWTSCATTGNVVRDWMPVMPTMLLTVSLLSARAICCRWKRRPTASGMTMEATPMVMTFFPDRITMATSIFTAARNVKVQYPQIPTTSRVSWEASGNSVFRTKSVLARKALRHEGGDAEALENVIQGVADNVDEEDLEVEERQ